MSKIKDPIYKAVCRELNEATEVFCLYQVYDVYKTLPGLYVNTDINITSISADDYRLHGISKKPILMESSKTCHSSFEELVRIRSYKLYPDD